MKYLLVLLVACSSLKYQDFASNKLVEYSVKKRVLVLDFFNDSPYGGEQLANYLTSDIRRYLAVSASRAVVETDLEFPSSKEIYSGGGGIQTNQLIRLAQDKGYNLVVVGRIKDFKVRENVDDFGILRKNKILGELAIEVKAIDVLQGAEVFSKTFTKVMEDSKLIYFFSKSSNIESSRNSSYRRMVHALIATMTDLSDLISKIEWTGRIIKVMGNKYYIDAGKKSKLYIGDILQVVTRGEEIIDPENGSIIGLTKGEIKATLEVIDYNGENQAVAVVYSGGTVLEGDLVQLYNN